MSTFSNYSVIAWRQLKKNRIYSVINIAGLAIGMAVSLLIGLWAWDELTVNHPFKNHHQLAKIVSITTLSGPAVAEEDASVPMGDELRTKFSQEIKDLSLYTNANPLLTVGDKKISQWGIWAQKGFPSMFSLKMVEGDQQALSDPYAMLISQSTARALFGQTDPMNRTVRVGNQTDMRVKGVYEDIPDNTELTSLNFLLAWDNKDNPGDSARQDWTDHHFGLYVQVSDGTDIDKLSARIKNITKQHLKGSWEELLLHPMDRWHLYNRFSNGKMISGRAQSVWLFSLIGLFVLILACINFMNLSTARSEKRAKEVGIRKTIGSLRGQLIGQFLTESFLFVGLALVLSLLLAAAFLPLFNTLAGKTLVLPIGNIFFWLLLLGFTGFTGLMAGSYPAFYLSAFQPVQVLKGVLRSGAAAGLARRSLVVLQFTVSISLIIGSIIVFRQLQYIKNRPVGYSREGLITVEMNTPEIKAHYEVLRDDLLRSGVVEAVAKSSSPPTDVQNAMLGYSWKGKDPNTHAAINTVFISADYGRTLKWAVREGRDFMADLRSDSDAIIVNEAAARFIGIEHPVNELIRWHQQDHRIIGVINDMTMQSPFRPAEPTFFMLHDRSMHVVNIRLRPTTAIRDALAKIGGIFQSYNPVSPFEYAFTDERYAAKYDDEERLEKMVGIFTILAVLISCLGLFGLASFVAEQRTKEIGVRKVLGASIFDLWRLLSVEFVRLVLLACGLAIPLAWYLSHRWLEAYAWHTTITWWLFLMAGAGALLITLLTVSYQAIRAALINPAKSLK